MASFILAIEPLANIIRKNRRIHPVIIPNQKPKCIGQYADDTTIFTTSAKDFNEITKMTKTFERGAGAKMNLGKTEVLLIGKFTEEERKFIPSQIIQENVKILGIYFGENADKLNREKILKKIDAIIEFWKNIPLSFEGKKLIIKTKILSQFYHTVRITGLKEDLRKNIQKRIAKFIWHPKEMTLLPYSTLQNSIDEGGLHMPNLTNINKAILTERIRKIIIRDPPWKGQMIYRLGYSLRNIESKFASSLYAHTFTQTNITETIISTYEELKSKVTDWKTADFKSLKDLLHQNKPYRKQAYRNYNNTWRNINNISNNKWKDCAYLVAHDCMPTTDVLVRRGLKVDVRCRLCSKQRETTKHLFLECEKIQSTKVKLEQCVGRRTNEEEILYHEGRAKMKKKVNDAIAAYKHSIWTGRAMKYTGEITDTQVETVIQKLFTSKIEKKK